MRGERSHYAALGVSVPTRGKSFTSMIEFAKSLENKPRTTLWSTPLILSKVKKRI